MSSFFSRIAVIGFLLTASGPVWASGLLPMVGPGVLGAAALSPNSLWPTGATVKPGGENILDKKIILGALGMGKMDASGRKVVLHEIKLEGGKPYTIQVNSPAFAALVRVKDSMGNLLLFNDDFMGSKNPQVTFTPPASGTYEIGITSYKTGVVGGTYTVTVSH